VSGGRQAGRLALQRGVGAPGLRAGRVRRCQAVYLLFDLQQLRPDQGGKAVNEDSPLFPQSLYAETKIAAEQWLLEKAKTSPVAPLHRVEAHSEGTGHSPEGLPSLHGGYHRATSNLTTVFFAMASPLFGTASLPPVYRLRSCGTRLTRRVWHVAH